MSSVKASPSPRHIIHVQNGGQWRHTAEAPSRGRWWIQFLQIDDNESKQILINYMKIVYTFAGK